MLTATTTDRDMERAKKIWAEYQKAHGEAIPEGQAVAVDLETARVLIGPSTYVIRTEHPEVGVRSPLMVVRPSGADLRLLQRLRGGQSQRAS